MDQHANYFIVFQCFCCFSVNKYHLQNVNTKLFSEEKCRNDEFSIEAWSKTWSCRVTWSQPFASWPKVLALLASRSAQPGQTCWRSEKIIQLSCFASLIPEALEASRSSWKTLMLNANLQSNAGSEESPTSAAFKIQCSRWRLRFRNASILRCSAFSLFQKLWDVWINAST